MNRYDTKMEELDTWFKRPDLEGEFRKPPINLSEIDLTELEREIEHYLPRDYREFLRDYSGHIFFATPMFPLRNADRVTGAIALFFGAGDDLLSQYRNACQSDWPLDQTIGLTLIRPIEEFEVLPYEQEKSLWVLWPTELLPIGNNGGNDEVCLVISGKQKGHVYYWLNDPGTGNPSIYHVANSFDEFMHLLHLPDDE